MEKSNEKWTMKWFWVIISFWWLAWVCYPSPLLLFSFIQLIFVKLKKIWRFSLFDTIFSQNIFLKHNLVWTLISFKDICLYHFVSTPNFEVEKESSIKKWVIACLDKVPSPNSSSQKRYSPILFFKIKLNVNLMSKESNIF